MKFSLVLDWELSDLNVEYERPFIFHIVSSLAFHTDVNLFQLLDFLSAEIATISSNARSNTG